ncbi:hypothetical protein N658DRAFT_169132 [Parathielavia hyrcaniae]|uniref:Uncharacterized protein n=1 Tax=Parathielavia hyrcaniae TaxID=113614 RepID=A0AAN6Q099_9PEZI|nr:hypothetical protein N658DRAFT_169132 [Parathielavia hyrcaniae]
MYMLRQEIICPYLSCRGAAVAYLRHAAPPSPPFLPSADIGAQRRRYFWWFLFCIPADESGCCFSSSRTSGLVLLIKQPQAVQLRTGNARLEKKRQLSPVLAADQIRPPLDGANVVPQSNPTRQSTLGRSEATCSLLPGLGVLHGAAIAHEKDGETQEVARPRQHLAPHFFLPHRMPNPHRRPPSRKPLFAQSVLLCKFTHTIH